MNLLEVRQLTVSHPVRTALLGPSRLRVPAVVDATLSMPAGETVGLVGESGCGKSTLGRAILRLIEPDRGEVWLDGENLSRLRGEALRQRRRKLQMVFQDPHGSLNSRLTVARTLAEPFQIHRLAGTREEVARRVRDALGQVGLDASMAHRYPHELSGGQRQRVGIARALAVEPRLLVLDEPVSALDVSVQAQIINLLQDLQAGRGLAYLFISHDLATVEHLCHRVLVMYLGRIVEAGPARAVLESPRHPYTAALKSAVLTLDPASGSRRMTLTGEPGSLLDPPAGCPFHPRCPRAEARCRAERPALRRVGSGHEAACHLAESPPPGNALDDPGSPPYLPAHV